MSYRSWRPTWSFSLIFARWPRRLWLLARSQSLSATSSLTMLVCASFDRAFFFNYSFSRFSSWLYNFDVGCLDLMYCCIDVSHDSFLESRSFVILDSFVFCEQQQNTSAFVNSCTILRFVSINFVMNEISFLPHFYLFHISNFRGACGDSCDAGRAVSACVHPVWQLSHHGKQPTLPHYHG